MAGEAVGRERLRQVVQAQPVPGGFGEDMQVSTAGDEADTVGQRLSAGEAESVRSEVASVEVTDEQPVAVLAVPAHQRTPSTVNDQGVGGGAAARPRPDGVIGDTHDREVAVVSGPCCFADDVDRVAVIDGFGPAGAGEAPPGAVPASGPWR